MRPRRLSLLCAVVAGLLVSGPVLDGQTASAAGESIHTQIHAWVQNMLSSSTDRMGVQKVMDLMTRKVPDSTRDVQVILGAQLARTALPQMALTWAGELAVFDLTPEEAYARGIYAGGFSVVTFDPDSVTARVVSPPVRLGNIAIDTPGPLTANKPIALSVEASSSASLGKAPLILRAHCVVDSKTLTIRVQLQGLPADGVIRFTLPPIADTKDPVAFGPVPLLVDVLLPAPAPGAIASNLVATILEIQPDLDGYAAAVVATVNDIVTVLQSIRDRPSADRAIDDYKRLAARNDALARVAERLGSFTTGQNAEFDRKYGARIQAAAERLRVETDRLQRAPYAGQAFFDAVVRALKQG